MSVTETTTVSWGSRLGSSLKGIVFGLILFVLGFPLLFWNEGRTVTATKTNEFGAANVVEADIGKVDAAQDGKLVHLVGEAKTDEQLKDEEYGVTNVAFQLARKVEMYQWVEKKETHEEKKMGGKIEKTTTYSYVKDWCDQAVSSDAFKEKDKINPPARRTLGSDRIYAQKASFGARRLNDSQIKSIGGSEALVTKYNPVGTNEFFEVTSVPEPKIGDIRATFTVVKSPKQITVVAAQQGDTFTAFTVPTTKQSISHVLSGSVDATGVFAAAEKGNKTLAWILRFVGFLMMFVGLKTVLAPLQVLGDVVPFIGSIIGIGTGLVSFLVALPCALVTIAVAWIFYRPVIGISLLVVAVACVVLLVMKRKGAKPPTP